MLQDLKAITPLVNGIKMTAFFCTNINTLTKIEITLLRRGNRNRDPHTNTHVQNL